MDIYLLSKFAMEAASSADYCSLKMIWCSLSKIRTHKGGDEALVCVFFYLSLRVRHSSSSLHLNWRQHRCRPRSPFPSNNRLRVSICMDKTRAQCIASLRLEQRGNLDKWAQIPRNCLLFHNNTGSTAILFPITIEVADRKTIMCCGET